MINAAERRDIPQADFILGATQMYKARKSQLARLSKEAHPSRVCFNSHFRTQYRDIGQCLKLEDPDLLHRATRVLLIRNQFLSPISPVRNAYKDDCKHDYTCI